MPLYYANHTRREQRRKRGKHKTEQQSSHTFQLIITPHLLIQLYLHLIKEVGTAVVLPSLDVWYDSS